MSGRTLLSFVMAGRSRPKDGVAFARLCLAIREFLKQIKQDVDARHKAGHDNDVGGAGQS
jgi:hypothetical protein